MKAERSGILCDGSGRLLKPLRAMALLAVLAVATLFGCNGTAKLYESTTVDYRDEAGGVLLSVNSVSRWEQVSEAMQPKFTLASGDAALTKVLPTTARIQKQVLSALGLSLGAGLPQSLREVVNTTTSSLTQTNSTTGGTTTTGSESSQGTTAVTTDTPATIPSAPTGTPAGGTMPSAASPGTDLGVDPHLQYRAAAALYQAVQLMNREVEMAAKRTGYVPYLVRLQLATVPYRRHLPYDIHAQVEFFPADRTLRMSEANDMTRLPYVLPLIATDNLEQAVNSRAAEVARQIGLALSAMVQGFGGELGTNWQKRDQESIYAADLNSLLTVSRLNDNGIYIRLGAANEATGRYSMVGRTYDIALLLLIPQEYLALRCPKGCPQTATDPTPEKTLALRKARLDEQGCKVSQVPPTLSIIVHTDLRDTLSGAVLPERRTAAHVKQLDTAFERTLKTCCPCMLAAWSAKTADEKLSVAKKLTVPIQTSEYKSFYDEAKQIKLEPVQGECTPLNSEPKDYRLASIGGAYLRSLWSYLASTLLEGSTKSASVELPRLPKLSIPEQTAVLRDDGKEKSTVVLRDVSGVTSGTISARLELKQKAEKAKDAQSYQFPAEALSLDTTTGTLTLQFPSPGKWKLGDIDYAGSTLRIASQPCAFTQEEACRCTSIPEAGCLKLLYAAVPEADKPKPGLEFRTTTSQIVVDKGVGSVKLVFDKFKDDKAEITWSGAEVKSAKNAAGNNVEINLDKITITGATVLTLDLQNAKPDGKVTFKVTGTKGNKTTGEDSKEFTVVAGSK